MGKTLLSLFSRFDREELCQLYIYPAMPDVDRCCAYYRITDKDVLRAFPGRRPGKEIRLSPEREAAGLYEDPGDEALYRNRKNKSALRRLLRDAMWSLSRWYSPDLKAWLDREQPDRIFVAPGVARFLYDFALQISRDRDIPIVTYLCDEYYFVKQPEQWLDRWRLQLLKQKIRQMMTASVHLVAITEELRQAYSQEFGIRATALMTGSSFAAASQPRVVENPREIRYFGNIRCNRFHSLAQVGRALDRYNQAHGTNCRLRIFTAEKDPQILSHFSGIESCEICGFLTGDAFRKAFTEAELLLHTEAFDEDSIAFVQHSLSTKIPDSLASGVPLLAYGPEEIASMQHLIRNGCALTATAEDQLYDMLCRAFQEEKESCQMVSRALETARREHDEALVSDRLRRILKEAAE